MVLLILCFLLKQVQWRVVTCMKNNAERQKCRNVSDHFILILIEKQCISIVVIRKEFEYLV